MSSVDGAPATEKSPTRWELLRGPVISGAIGLSLVSLVHFRDPHVAGSYGFCPFQQLVGLPCPGCGGLRSINLLSNGDWQAALSSNAVVVIGSFVAAIAWLVWLVRRVQGQPTKYLTGRVVVFWILLVVVLAFGIFRWTPWGGFLAP